MPRDILLRKSDRSSEMRQLKMSSARGKEVASAEEAVVTEEDRMETTRGRDMKAAIEDTTDEQANVSELKTCIGNHKISYFIST